LSALWVTKGQGEAAREGSTLVMCGRNTYLLSWQEVHDLYGMTSTADTGAGGGGDDGAAPADAPPPDFKKRFNLPHLPGLQLQAPYYWR
jgi:hypothetical protein